MTNAEVSNFSQFCRNQESMGHRRAMKIFSMVHGDLMDLTLIREFLGPSLSAFSGKNPESSLVTSQLGL